MGTERNKPPAWAQNDANKVKRGLPRGVGVTFILEAARVKLVLSNIRQGGDRDHAVRELEKLGWSAASYPDRKRVEAYKRR